MRRNTLQPLMPVLARLTRVGVATAQNAPAACCPEVAKAVAATRAPGLTATVLKAGEGARRLGHGLGESALPRNPQRLVVLEPSLNDAALAFGVTLVGAHEFIGALPGGYDTTSVSGA